MILISWHLFVGCKDNLGVYTFNDEGLAYNDLKWHSLEALRYNGIYANITIDRKWTGEYLQCHPA